MNGSHINTNCIYCGSSKTVSKGKRRTATMGDRLRRRCKDCGREFTVGRSIGSGERTAPESSNDQDSPEKSVTMSPLVSDESDVEQPRRPRDNVADDGATEDR